MKRVPHCAQLLSVHVKLHYIVISLLSWPLRRLRPVGEQVQHGCTQIALLRLLLVTVPVDLGAVIVSVAVVTVMSVGVAVVNVMSIVIAVTRVVVSGAAVNVQVRTGPPPMIVVFAIP